MYSSETLYIFNLFSRDLSKHADTGWSVSMAFRRQALLVQNAERGVAQKQADMRLISLSGEYLQVGEFHPPSTRYMQTMICLGPLGSTKSTKSSIQSFSLCGWLQTPVMAALATTVQWNSILPIGLPLVFLWVNDSTVHSLCKPQRAIRCKSCTVTTWRKSQVYSHDLISLSIIICLMIL